MKLHNTERFTQILLRNRWRNLNDLQTIAQQCRAAYRNIN